MTIFGNKATHNNQSLLKTLPPTLLKKVTTSGMHSFCIRLEQLYKSAKKERRLQKIKDDMQVLAVQMDFSPETSSGFKNRLRSIAHQHTVKIF